MKYTLGYWLKLQNRNALVEVEGMREIGIQLAGTLTDYLDDEYLQKPAKIKGSRTLCKDKTVIILSINI